MVALDEKLVAEWRRTRDPKIVEELRKRLALKVRRAPRSGNLDAAWAAAVEQKNFQELLELLLCGTLRAMDEKVRALGQLDDPRVNSVLQPALVALGPDARADLLPIVIEVLGRSKDVSCIWYLEQYEEEQPERVAEAIAQLQRVKPKPVADLGALVNPKPQREADLFAAVYRDPGDLDARAVLADALQERGDPRGEFISLQLGADSAASRGRAEALLSQHKRAWTAPLTLNESRSDGAKVKLFDRGFLHTAVVDRLAGQQHLREWSTVEHLFADRMHENQPAMRKLAQSSKALRSLFWLDLESVGQIKSSQLENVGVWCFGSVEKKHLAGLTGLRALWLMPSSGFKRATLPWERLERVFMYEGDEASWEDWLGQLRSRRKGPLVQVSLLESRGWMPELYGWELRFRLDADQDLEHPELIWHSTRGVRSPAQLTPALLRRFSAVTVRAPAQGAELAEDQLGGKFELGRWFTRGMQDQPPFERLTQQFPDPR